jgi:heme exporter protein B
VRGALAIFAKDLRIEWRTRESLASVFVLGVLLLVVFSVAHDAPPEEAPALAPAVLWATFVFTGVLGVQRGFLLERENDCLAGLLVSPVDPAAIFAGKCASNVVLLAVMQAIVVPLVGLFLHLDLRPVLPGLAVVLLLGNVGFAALATLLAAVAVRTRAREVMLPLLLLPLLVPLLIGAVQATRAVLAGGLGEARGGLAVLAAFDVVFAVAGWLLFAYVVRD